MGHHVNMALAFHGAKEKFLGHMFTTVKITAFSSWKFFTLLKEQYFPGNMRTVRNVGMQCSILGSSMTPVCLDPCSLSKSQLVAVCLGFLFPTRGGYWSMDTVLGLLDP